MAVTDTVTITVRVVGACRRSVAYHPGEEREAVRPFNMRKKAVAS